MRKEIDRLLNKYTAEDDSASAEVIFPEGFTGFQGHFPEKPVLPGVYQITLALVMADRMSGRSMKLGSVTNAKFISMVQPGQAVSICCTLSDGKLKAKLSSGDERVAEFLLKVEHA